VILPFGLSLPALAIGRRDFQPLDAADAVSGNGLRLVAVYWLVYLLPTTVIGWPVAWLTTLYQDGLAAAALHVLINDLILVVDAVLFAAALSFSYAAIVQQRTDLLAPNPSLG
jgi:hypothetical protein